MSKQAAYSFLDQVSSHAELRDQIRDTYRLEASRPETANRLQLTVQFAARLGYVFTGNEFLDALQDRYQAVELSDAALEVVTGGRWSPVAASAVLATFPDVCKTPAPPAPAVPIPYPNTGSAHDSSKGH